MQRVRLVVLCVLLPAAAAGGCEGSSSPSPTGDAAGGQSGGGSKGGSGGQGGAPSDAPVADAGGQGGGGGTGGAGGTGGGGTAGTGGGGGDAATSDTSAQDRAPVLDTGSGPPDRAPEAPAVKKECVDYCRCMLTICSRVPDYPFANEMACQRRCTMYSNDELTCFTKWCEKASTGPADTKAHTCEHAWGKFGLNEC